MRGRVGRFMELWRGREVEEMDRKEGKGRGSAFVCGGSIVLSVFARVSMAATRVSSLESKRLRENAMRVRCGLNRARY